MNIKQIKIDQLKLDPTNSRKHNQANIEAIKASLSEFGQQKPIIITKDNVVLAGNGTVTAARELGWAEISAKIFDAPDVKAKAYAIADNRSAELAEWNTDQLLQTLQDIADADLLPAVGFDNSYIDNLSNLLGGTPDLDALLNEIGDPTDEDNMTRVSFLVPPEIAADWNQAVKAVGKGSDLDNTIELIKIAYRAVIDE